MQGTRVMQVHFRFVKGDTLLFFRMCTNITATFSDLNIDFPNRVVQVWGNKCLGFHNSTGDLSLQFISTITPHIKVSLLEAIWFLGEEEHFAVHQVIISTSLHLNHVSDAFFNWRKNSHRKQEFNADKTRSKYSKYVNVPYIVYNER